MQRADEPINETWLGQVQIDAETSKRRTRNDRENSPITTRLYRRSGQSFDSLKTRTLEMSAIGKETSVKKPYCQCECYKTCKET